MVGMLLNDLVAGTPSVLMVDCELFKRLYALFQVEMMARRLWRLFAHSLLSWVVVF